MLEIQCPVCGCVFSVSEDCCAGLCSKCGKPFITASALDLRRKNIEEAQAKESGFVINGDKLLRYCCGSGEVNIPEGIVSIGDDVFSGRTDITCVNLPEGLKYIGDRAFLGCKSLENIIFPESLRRIGKYAFKDCTGLTSVHIPAGVNSVPRAAVGDSAFAGCKGLISISVSGSIRSFPNGVFDGCGEDVVVSWKNLRDDPRCCDVVMRRTQAGLCPFCGGEISGLFRRKCTICGEGE